MTAPPIPIIASGSGWLAVDKPSGLSVHNDPGKDLCSLLTRQFESDATDQSADLPHGPFRLHPVHRLDKETSGVLLLAWDKAVFRHFSEAFAAGRVSKRYLALVHGTDGGLGRGGQWRWPLSPTAAGRKNIQGAGRRVPSKTTYRFIHSGRRYSLLECELLTGRTHQIRRHAALSGHPVLGDRRYGSPRACRFLAEHHGFNRLALHCTSLRIKPPESETRRWLASATLPVSIQRILASDGGADDTRAS
jgi:23S rRNA-/tRNA-specific pseudouridylate synthase